MNIESFYQEINKSNIDKPKSFNIAGACTKIWKQTPIRKAKGLTQLAYSIRKKAGYDTYQVNSNPLDYEIKYKHLYNILSDEKSRKTLLCILKFRLSGIYADFHTESDYIANQYFDKNIVSLTDNEVFVDCGGFTGDTTDIFLNKVHNFSKVYIYEPNPNNHKKTSHLLSINHPDKIDKIIIRNAGVGLTNMTSKVSLAGSASQISDTGKSEINIVSLDKDITEPLSFIKMDVEGFEMDALKGAKQHIISEKPKLAICVYHKLNDLWEIPEYILSLNPSYKLYLRQYFYNDGECYNETVLYAI